MVQGTSTWEDLRRQARQVENEIDSKLISLNKLSGQKSRLDVSFSSQEKTPLLASEGGLFDSLCSEIEHLLTVLTDLNNQMSDLTQPSSGNAQTNPAFLHTLQRHRDILRDYSAEFGKTKANIQERLQREELMGAVAQDIDIAIATKEHLTNQRVQLKDVTKRLHVLIKKYPALNSLMQRIQVKRKKDTVIIALVISVCLFLLFLYAVH